MDITFLDQNFLVSAMPIDAIRSLSISDAWDCCGKLSSVVTMAAFQSARAASYMYVLEDTYRITAIKAEQTVSVSAEHLNGILADVVVLEDEVITGPAETEARRLVNKYAIGGAQAISKLALGTLAGYSATATGNVAVGTQLMDALYTMLSPLGMSYRLAYDFANDAISFSVLSGVDRTQGQTANAWVTFSTSAENIENVTYTKNTEDYKNYAYVSHTNNDVTTVVEVDQTNGARRRAVYVTASDIDTEVTTPTYTEQLQAAGAAALAEYAIAESLSGSAKAGTFPQYGAEYALGDLVDIVDVEKGIAETKRVTSVIRVYEPEGITVTPTFGDSLLTLREYIKREVNNA